MLVFHGTDIDSALRLAAGERLSAKTAADRKIDGAAGFYLALELVDAEYFALRRSPASAVFALELSDAAISQLSGAGMLRRPIPRGARSPRFGSDELWMPPGAFDLFDSLREAGEIRVLPLP